jgi:hypothetical protein
MHAVALVVVHGASGALIGNLVEVRAAQARDLRVDVRVDAALQQRVVAEVDAGHDVRRAERDLLGLGEEVVGIAIEHHAADGRDGTSSSGISLVGSRTSKLKARPAPREHLQAQLPLRIVPGLDGLPQIAPVEVRSRAR